MLVVYSYHLKQATIKHAPEGPQQLWLNPARDGGEEVNKNKKQPPF